MSGTQCCLQAVAKTPGKGRCAPAVVYGELHCVRKASAGSGNVHGKMCVCVSVHTSAHVCVLGGKAAFCQWPLLFFFPGISPVLDGTTFFQGNAPPSVLMTVALSKRTRILSWSFPAQERRGTTSWGTGCGCESEAIGTLRGGCSAGGVREDSTLREAKRQRSHRWTSWWQFSWFCCLWGPLPFPLSFCLCLVVRHLLFSSSSSFFFFKLW